MERERHLDEAGHARRALGVSDLRLHRAERDGSHGRARRREHLGERQELGAIAHDGARAVRLDEAHLGRRDRGGAVGPREGAHLAFFSRRGEPEALPVAPAGDALDHGVHAIAVALRVGEPLEDEARDALAEHDAVRVRVERPARARRRERVDAGEQEVIVDAVVQIRAAAEHHVARPRRELLHRQIERRERGRARRVHRVVDAAEIEPVRDPPRDHVRQNAGERVLREHREVLVERLRDRPRVLRIERAEAVRRAEIRPRLRAEDDARAIAIERALPVAGVVERALGDLQAQELHRLDRDEGSRRDAVNERIERDRREEPAPLRARSHAARVVRIVIEIGVPALLRDLGDGALPREDVRPERAPIRRVREHARHPDDRDVRGLTRRSRDDAALHHLLDPRGRALAHVAVELGERHDFPS